MVLDDAIHSSRSGPVPMPRTARDVVADLRALLHAPGVPSPYILVGHSYGGLFVRLYTSTYPDKVAGVYFRLLENLQAQPVKVGDHTVDGVVFQQISDQSLYQDQWLPIVAPLWQCLARAPGAPSEAEAEQLLTQLLAAVPLAPDLQQIILPTALAVICQDTAWPRSVETYQQSRTLDAVLFPVTGAMSGNIWPCAFWRYPPTEPPVPITDRGPRNILMLQNLRDPATGAHVMKDVLGSRAAMVVVDQGGHGVYGAFNLCGNEAATAWLTQGTLPPHDVLCPAEVLYGQEADKLFVPGSIMKTYSTATVLDAYGPDYRFRTPVYRDGEVSGGVLTGNLILVASGDFSMGLREQADDTLAYNSAPELDHSYANNITGAALIKGNPLTTLHEFATQVRDAGIHEVHGDIVIDARLFTPFNGWPDGLSSPIWVNENLIDVLTMPTRPGQQAAVVWRPRTAAYTVDAHVETVNEGEPTNLTIDSAAPGVIRLRGRQRSMEP